MADWLSVEKRYAMTDTVRPGQKNIVLILFLFFLAVGILFRVYGLGERNLWTDEAWVALAATQPTTAAVLQEGKSTPPLFLLTVWGMVQVWGRSETALRLTSCLLGLGTLLLLWPLAQALLPPGRALTVFALASVSPRLVYFSKELKQYSADIFFAVLVFWLVERQLAPAGTGRLAAIYGPAGPGIGVFTPAGVHFTGGGAGFVVGAAPGQESSLLIFRRLRSDFFGVLLVFLSRAGGPGPADLLAG